MQGQMTRPTDERLIAYAGTPNEMWWSHERQEWVKAPTIAPNLDKLVQVYRAIGDARTVARQAWEKKDTELEEDQLKLRAAMLDILNRTGAKSVATEHGTVYRSEKIKPSAADWSAIQQWIAENPDRFELLEKRLKSTFVKEYMEENEGRAPPGVNVHREFEVSVRRPSTSK